MHVVIPDATQEEMLNYWGKKCPELNVDCEICKSWCLWEITREMLISVDRNALLRAVKEGLL